MQSTARRKIIMKTIVIVGGTRNGKKIADIGQQMYQRKNKYGHIEAYFRMPLNLSIGKIEAMAYVGLIPPVSH